MSVCMWKLWVVCVCISTCNITGDGFACMPNTNVHAVISVLIYTDGDVIIVCLICVCA